MSPLDLPFLPTNTTHQAPAKAPALFDDSSDNWLSYGALRDRIHAKIDSFRSETRGLVFCCIPRSIDGAVAYLAASASGNAIGLIDPTIPHLHDVISSYQPEWIVAPADQKFTAYEDCAWSDSSLKLWQRKKPSKEKLHPDFYLLLLTSGSTGSHKAVRLTYQNLAHNTGAIIASLGITSATRAAQHLPLSYSFGMSVLNMQLAVGGSCILSEHGILSRKFWHIARAEKANLLPGVPYHYEMIQRLGIERLDVPELKTFIQAGGKMRLDMTESVLQRIQRRNGELFVMYGQTEAAPRISCFPLHQFPNKIGSAGRALNDGKFEIVDGEIVYSGPNVMYGYAEKRADLALGDVMHNRLVTGDMGTVDEEGFLFISGRKQRFAKLYGQRIALDDLEKIAREVAPAIAIETSEKIMLMTTSNETEARQHMKDLVVAQTKLPATWIEVKRIHAIPYQPSGKVDYVKLREMAQ